MKNEFLRLHNTAKRIALILLVCGVTNVSYSQACACKQRVQVSLSAAGTAEVTVPMLLTDNATCAGTQTVQVMLTPTGQPIAGSPFVNCSHAGKTLYGKVSNGTNSCWAYLDIEDKIKPVITCPTGPRNLTCSEMANFVPPVVEACGVLKLETVGQDIVVNNACLPGGPPPNILKTITRTYQATDVNGNKSELCTIVFNVTTIPSLNDIVMPPSYLISNDSQLECDGNWAKLVNGNPDPLDIKNTQGMVTNAGTGVPKLGAESLFQNEKLYCNINVDYDDAKVKVGCVTKIIRTWTVVEWSCANRTRAPYIQVIEIQDTQGPEFDDINDVIASTSDHDCEALVTLPRPVLDDNCAPASSITVDITIYQDGDEDKPVVFIKSGAPRTATLPIGQHKATYTAYDNCYNKTEYTIDVLVEDNTAPVAICDEFATVGLTSDGSAWVPATVFDDGSYDECKLNKLLVRRMNTSNCGPCEVASFPGFTYLGDFGEGTNKHYYYLSQHEADAKVAYKMAKAMGGVVVSYETLAESNWVGSKVFQTIAPAVDSFLIGLNDLTLEGSFKWDSGLPSTYTMPWNSGEPNNSGDYVVQTRTNLRWSDTNTGRESYKYVVEVSALCGWSSAALFCCSDIGTNQMVAFRAIDAAGNFNDCMVSAVIQDKIGPTISCPADRTVDCSFVFDPLNLAASFGNANGDDNCENPRVTEKSVIDISACRQGTIVRTFTVTDAGGKSATCTQTITFRPNRSETYQGPTANQWPRDTTITGCFNSGSASFLPAALGSPILSNGVCSMAGSDYIDQVFSFNNPSGPACFKILRKWTVVDWCQKLDDGSYRQWVYTQEIKVVDKVAPVFDPLSPTISANTLDENCASGSINLKASAKDVCTTTLRWSYKLDSLNNGTIDKTVQGNGNSIDFILQYPVGSHRIIYSFEDRCGNVSSREQIFTIVNVKAPNAYVKQGLAMNLVDMPVVGPMAEIWAKDFDNGSSHPCGYTLLFSFEKVTLSIVDGKPVMVGVPNFVYDCDDIPNNVKVTIWVAALTPEGGLVQSSVETFIDIQDNNNVCDTDDIGSNIQGRIVTENNMNLEEANVVLKGSELNTTTNKDGVYNFRNVSTGNTYQVVPEKNDDPLNGVSTLDLVLMQRHILNAELIASPYKLIAADVNKDKKISASDLVELRKLILGNIDDFGSNKSWRFVDKSYKFADAAHAEKEVFSELYHIETLEADMVTDFIAVKIGDVNNNAVANNLQEATDGRTNQNITLTTDNYGFEQGQKVVIPIYIDDATELTGMQFTMLFDAEYLEFSHVESASIHVEESNFGFSGLYDGNLTFSWHDVDNKVFAANTNMFNLIFTAQKPGQIADLLDINDTKIQAEAYDHSNQVMRILWKPKNSVLASTIVLHQNTPNPFNQTTTIHFELPDAMSTVVTITDVTGKQVLIENVEGVKGSNFIHLNSQTLPKGLLYYSLKAGDFKVTKKMVHVE